GPRDGSGRSHIERFRLSTSSSLGMLTWPSNPRRPTASFLVAADPLGGVPKPVQVASRRGFASVRDGLGPLEFAPEEAQRVKGQFSGAVELIGPQAREGEVKRQMGKYALLHFATHGILDEQEGLRSWLLLAPEPPESTED